MFLKTKRETDTAEWLARCLTVLVCLVILGSGPGHTKTLELDGKRAIVDLTEYLTLYQSADTRSGEQRLRPVDEQKSVDAEVWQGVVIANRSAAPIEKVFVLRHPAMTGSGLMGTMGRPPAIGEVVIVEAEKPLISDTSFIRAGDQFFTLTLPAGKEVIVGFQVDTPPRSGMVSLWSPRAFERYNRSSLIMHNMLIGALLIMAILLLAVRLYANSPACLWSGLISLSTALYFASYFGYIPNNVEFLGFLDITLANCYLILSVIFGLELLLKVTDFSPSQVFQQKSIEATQYAAIFVLIIVLLGVPETGSVARVFVLIAALLATVTLPLQARNKNYGAKLILPGAVIILVACLAVAALSFASSAAFLIALEPLAYVFFAAGIALLSFASLLSVNRVANASAYDVDRFDDEPVRETIVYRESPPEVIYDDSYEVAMIAAREGMWDLNVDTGTIRLSGYAAELLGRGDQPFEMSRDDWLELLHPGEQDAFVESLDRYIAQGNVVFDLSCNVAAADGKYLPLEIRAASLNDDDDGSQRCIGVLREITAYPEPPETHEDDGDDEDHLDALTGLAGKDEFLSRLRGAISAFKSHGPPPEGVARPFVMAIDIDRFKTFNDALGKENADSLLIEIVNRIQSALSEDDFLARVSGHEFALINYLDGHADDVTGIMREIQSSVAAVMEFDDQRIFPTISIGGAVCHDTDQSAESLLNEAQQALFEARKAGQGGAVVYQPGMGVDRSRELAFESELRRALERYEMEIFYQPIMDLRDGRIAGFESLIRWNHPSQGLLSPAQFVPTAEALGLIKPLGRFALSMTSLQLSQWQQFFELENPLFASVNVSTKQLLDNDLVDDFAEIMKSVELAPNSLKLEVTEAQLEGNEAEAAKLLSELREMGGGVVLDDFGTGHSTLERLKSLPFDTIKIDQSFVLELLQSDESKVMVKSVIDLAHNLGLDIVAEGVESEEAARALLGMGCNYAQGFIFGAPMTAMEAQAFIANYWSS